jgi:hypothetical protein
MSTDLATLVGVVIVLGLVASAAIWLPVRRAMRVDPRTALRLSLCLTMGLDIRTGGGACSPIG